MPSKKLLVVSTSFPIKPGDSLSPFIWEFCLNLSQRGWRVTVLVPHHRDLKDIDTWEGISVRRFRYLPERLEDIGYSGGILPNIKKKPWQVVKLPFYIWAMYRESLRLAVEERFDLVNFHWLFPSSFWLGQFVRSSGLPVVLTGHGTDVHLATRGILKMFADRAMKRASALTLNSEYMKRILKDNYHPSMVEIIPMGIDTGKFHPGETKPSQSKTVIYVGRLIRQKGIDLLVKAFARVVREIPDARLEIIGYGPEKDNLVRVLKAEGIDDAVKIIDTIPHVDLPQVYARARILALPSLIGEGLGMTPAEAGASGVPTITFGLGGTAELVIHEKTGLVVNPDCASLMEGLTRLMTNDRLADELGSNARHRVEQKLSWEKISAEFDALFSEIIGRSASSRSLPLSGNALNWAVFITLLATLGYIIKTAADRFERIMSIFK
jgi:glycosyltransferase involved in cell wall biosynthesis